VIVGGIAKIEFQKREPLIQTSDELGVVIKNHPGEV
jgi:hypothetical protein